MKRAFNLAAKFCKRILSRARFGCIRRIGSKLASYPNGSRAFWYLVKAVESNFNRSSLPPLLKSDGSLAHAAEEKANIFASLFAANSRLDTAGKTPPVLPRTACVMAEVRLHQRKILKILWSLDVNKASGPNGIPSIVLRRYAPELSPHLTRLYRHSLETGIGIGHGSLQTCNLCQKR